MGKIKGRKEKEIKKKVLLVFSYMYMKCSVVVVAGIDNNNAGSPIPVSKSNLQIEGDVQFLRPGMPSLM